MKKHSSPIVVARAEAQGNLRTGNLRTDTLLRREGPAIATPLAAPRAAEQQRRPTRGSLRWLVLVALLGGSAVALYWLFAPGMVLVVHPIHGPAVQAVYATGTVEPTVMVPISARSAARLVELDADEGVSVVKGQVLARLEDDDLHRTIDELAAEERFARADYERQKMLVERRVAAQASYERARANWEKAKAAAERAVVQLDFLKLVAPADGRVIRRDGEIGQLIAANQTVFWLSCCAPLRIAAEVDEEDIGEIHPGQPVLIRADAFPGKVFHGEVQTVTPKGDPVARSYRVRVALAEKTPLMVGMTAETNIILRQNENALLLPAGAVRQGAVWLVVDGRLVERKVATGAKGTAEVEIIEGVAEGDWIVATSAATLKPGQRVFTERAPAAK